MRGKALIALTALAAAAAPAHAALFYNPLVTVVGDGTTTGSAGVTTSVYLYNNSVAAQAAPISSVAYNNGAAGTRLVNGFSSTSEGALTNNPGTSDAAALGVNYVGTTYAYNAGYNATDGTLAVAAAAANADRSLGRVVATALTVSGATVLKTQTQATAYNASSIRGATGDNGGAGASLYSSGTASTATLGGWRDFNANTQLSAAPTNVRTVELLGTRLYGSTGSGTTVGIYTVDPTGTNPATTFVTTGTSTDHSPYEFALFRDPTNPNSTQGYNVAYIADDGVAAAAAGGIEKWTYNGSAWTQAYILKDTSTTNYRGLAGQLDASTGLVTLFAATSDGLKLQQVTDTGSGATFTTLASLTAASNTLFRGVALAPTPEPTTLALLVLGAVFTRGRRRA